MTQAFSLKIRTWPTFINNLLDFTSVYWQFILTVLGSPEKENAFKQISVFESRLLLFALVYENYG